MAQKVLHDLALGYVSNVIAFYPLPSFSSFPVTVEFLEHTSLLPPEALTLVVSAWNDDICMICSFISFRFLFGYLVLRNTFPDHLV